MDQTELNELRTLRHSASHILAQAVKRLYPDARLAIGPAIDTGFYYDFDTETTFTTEDLESIEAEMKKIVKENLRIERFTLPRDEAKKLIKRTNRRKYFRLALHGWMEFHIVAIETSTKTVLSNPAGRDKRKTLERNFAPKKKLL